MFKSLRRSELLIENIKSEKVMGDNRLVSNEELIFSNMLEIQAIIRILKRNGITDEDEILEEVKKLKAEMEEKIKKSGGEN